MILSHNVASSSAVTSGLVIIGSVLGGVVLIIAILIVLSVIVIARKLKTTNQSAPILVNHTTGYPTMSYRPEQSSVPFNLPQPVSEEPVTHIQTTDCDFTKAPPPAYDLHQNFTEYKETLPPSYSEVGNQPIPTPPSYTDSQ